MTSSSLATALTSQGLVADADIKAARRLQAETGGQFLDCLVRIGAVDEDALLACAAAAWGISLLDEADVPRHPGALSEAPAGLGLSEAWLASRQCFAWWDGAPESGRLVVAACNPIDPPLNEQVDRASETAERPVTVTWRLMSRAQFDMLASLLGEAGDERSDAEADGDLSRLRELAEEAPIIDLVNQVFAAAIKHRASDIHIEPHEKYFEIRLRIDGVVQSWQRQPSSRFDAVSTRIKLISAMDIAERRLPQDGRQSIRISGQAFDLRVSSLPGAWGESLVLRLLPKNKTLPSLDQLGLSGLARSQFSAVLSQPNGIVLVTGPTGSGKSTTLYTGLQSINDGQKKIITIEDPIEFNMERVTQVQVKPDIGLTFAAGLRSILRQDPDVIMIGEIRDPETARIAIQASLTGHLVLSTLHTNSSLLAIPRLLDLGLEPFQIGAAVRALAAQRLVRKVCPHCARPSDVPDQLDLLLRSCDPLEAEKIAARTGPAAWQAGEGCPRCAGTGYAGRIALFELVRIDAEVKSALLRGAGVPELEKAARLQGYRRLAEDGLEKARLGMTTVAEVLRVSSEDTVLALEPDLAGSGR